MQKYEQSDSGVLYSPFFLFLRFVFRSHSHSLQLFYQVFIKYLLTEMRDESKKQLLCREVLRTNWCLKVLIVGASCASVYLFTWK